MADTLPRDKVTTAVAIDSDEAAISSASRNQMSTWMHVPATVGRVSLVLAKPIPIVIVRAGTA